MTLDDSGSMYREPKTAEQAQAHYRALPASVHAALDFWIDHALAPARMFHEIDKTHFEHPAGTFVTDATFNGALLDHGYMVRFSHEGVDAPAAAKAKYTGAIRRYLRRTTDDALPEWYGEFTTLVQLISDEDERAALDAMGL